MDAACLALADIGRAALRVIAPGELGERTAALERGELGDGEARRTLNDLGLIAVTLRRAGT